jgi:lysophospholipase L1-like esterase
MKLFFKIALCVLVLFALYVYAEYRSFQQKVAIGVALAEKTTPYEQEVLQPTKRRLVVGDSTGVGVGADDPKHSLAGRLGASFPNASIINRAVSGAKVVDVGLQFDSVRGQQFDLVYIQIGGNDIVRFTNFGDIERGLETLIEKAKAYGSQVVVATSGNIGTAQIFPRGTRWLIRIRTQQVREVFMLSVPEETVHYVDLYKAERIDPFAADPKKYYAADSFHPSADGYAVWYETIFPVIAGLSGWENER